MLDGGGLGKYCRACCNSLLADGVVAVGEVIGGHGTMVLSIQRNNFTFPSFSTPPFNSGLISGCTMPGNKSFHSSRHLCDFFFLMQEITSSFSYPI